MDSSDGHAERQISRTLPRAPLGRALVGSGLEGRRGATQAIELMNRR